MTKTSTAPAARFTVDTYATGSDLTIGDAAEYQVIDGRNGDLVLSTSRQAHAVEFAGNLNARLSK
jgi:hypothetical protein